MNKTFQSPLGSRALLVLSLAASIPLYFVNVIQYSVPMGYAGLFTQMANQIADANFRLPMESPFYGPGSIPFAYPPFSLYALAILIKLTGKYFIFLRLLPPFISLIALIPLYFLTLELSDSPVAAASSVVIAATSADLYIAHAWAAGIVRAPAFLFALLAIYFFTRNSRVSSKTSVVLSGIFLGLTILTHLEYAVFCLGWIAFWTLFRKDFIQSVKDTLFITLIGFCISLFWVIPMLVRYGSGVFLNAFNSHGNASFVGYLGSFPGSVQLLVENFSSVNSNWVVLTLALIGIIFQFYKKKIALPLFFILILFVFRGERFGFLIESILAGIGISVIATLLASLLKNQSEVAVKSVSVIVVVAVLGYILWGGFISLKKMTPKIDDATLELAENAQQYIDRDGKYLALVVQDEAEWLPFLLQREPLVAQWGSEWLGTYYQQTNLMSLFRACQKDMDWSCVDLVFEEMGESPKYVITYKFEKNINEQILVTGNWKELYDNNRYILWQQSN